MVGSISILSTSDRADIHAARADAGDTIAYLDVVVDRDSDVSYEDVYVDMKSKKVKGRSDANDTIAYLDVVVDRDSDVSYEDVYVDMN
ncbi:hypothetical protein ACMFMF_011706 [Clarireedia jacksonii]